MAKMVMVVDDSAPVRQQVGLALREAGFDVVEAVDGQDGVEKLSAQPSICVVVCDVNMPRMNGIEFLASARGKCPVLMLTTEGHADLIAQAKSLGAKGWIIKPFKAPLLVAAVQKLAGV
jgi:two-component system chemotaxis response regulator CheY